MKKFWKHISTLACIGFVSGSCFGQNGFINNWSIHHSADTNIYIGFGTIDRLSMSNADYATWVNGPYNGQGEVLGQSSQNRELLRVGYSTPQKEVAYITSVQSFQQKRFNNEEFNGLLHGIYLEDSIRLGSLSSLYSSLIEHRLEFTRKLEASTLQLRLSGSHINTFNEYNVNGFITKGGNSFQGAYEIKRTAFNSQLDYLGGAGESLNRNLDWRDSVRITSLLKLPLIPSIGFYLSHRPTKFTEFSLLVDGLAPRSSLQLQYRLDSTNFALNSNLFSTRDLFSEETTLLLNGDYYYRENSITSVDTVLPIRVIPLRIEAGYKVKIEPLLHLGFYASYFEYQKVSYGRATFMVERAYNNENALQLGLTSYYISNSLKPNLSLGMRVRLSEKVMLYSFTDALLTAPWIDSEIVPGWTNRFSINATIQCQLL